MAREKPEERTQENLFTRADNAVQHTSAMSRANRPNYNMIAPANTTPGPSAPARPNPALSGTMRGNTRPPLRSAGNPGPSLLERQRANLSPSLGRLGSSAPPLGDTRASAVYGNSAIRQGVDAAVNYASSALSRAASDTAALPGQAYDTWAGTFPSTFGAAESAGPAIAAATERAGTPGAVGSTLRAIPQVLWGAAKDVGGMAVDAVDWATDPAARGLDELVTGDSTDPLTLGQIANWMTGGGGTTAAPATPPATPPASSAAPPVTPSATGRGPAPATGTRNPRGWISNGTRTLSLMSAANRERNVDRASDLRKQADALIRASQVQTQGDVAMARERGEMARANQRADVDRPYREAIAAAALQNAEVAGAELLARGNQPRDMPSWLTPENMPVMRDLLATSGLPQDEQANLYNSMLASMVSGATDGYAEGGLVEPPSAIGRAPAMLSPQMPGQQVMAEYQQLNSGLSAMGLAPVDFETFQSLKAPPQMQAQPSAGAGVMGFAEGGMVPDVSGKMVVDTDPAAPTDSIPAMVDGAQPAALDSGEFVLPKDVVMFYGLDKLNKMIAQARKVESDGPNAGQPGVSAIESAQRYA